MMDKGNLGEEYILNSIRRLSNEFMIKFGQAQKAINVLLKYHFYLTRSDDIHTKKVLNCPIDSLILKSLHMSGVRLTNIDEETYQRIQKEIQNRSPIRIDFDTRWDEQHLKKAGII